MQKMNKLVLIFTFVLITACSKEFRNSDINPAATFQTANVTGKHSVFISKEKFVHKKNFQSEECESWAVKLDFDNALRQSIKTLIEGMFKDYSFSDKKLSSSEIENSGYVSQISFYDFIGLSNFKTERNTAKYNLALKIKIKVESSNKNIVNEISSNMNWEKNIFLGCDLHVGATKSGQKALDTLLKKIYESTYESLYQITR